MAKARTEIEAVLAGLGGGGVKDRIGTLTIETLEMLVLNDSKRPDCHDGDISDGRT